MHRIPQDQAAQVTAAHIFQHEHDRLVFEKVGQVDSSAARVLEPGAQRQASAMMLVKVQVAGDRRLQ
jgi:hypothetical protein